MPTFRERFRAAQGFDKSDPMPHELMSPELAPPTLREQIQNSIRSELSILAQDRGLESFEEADDFEEEDGEADMLSAYQIVLMNDESDESLEGGGPELPQEPPEPVMPDEAPDPPSDAPDVAPAAS